MELNYQEQNIVFKKLAGDVRQLKVEDVYSSDGKPAPFNWFDSGTRRRGVVVVVSATPPLQPITGLLSPVRLGYMSSAVYFATESTCNR